MRRKYTIFALIVLLTLLILIYRFYSEKIKEAEKKERITDNYILINIDGVVHLFRDDIIIQVYDTVNPYTLPLQDQDNLKSGIKVKSVEEAAQLIEDFDG